MYGENSRRSADVISRWNRASVHLEPEPSRSQFQNSGSVGEGLHSEPRLAARVSCPEIVLIDYYLCAHFAN